MVSSSIRTRMALVGVIMTAIAVIIPNAVVQALPAQAAESQTAAPTGLTVNGLSEPLDVDIASPVSFSWIVPTGSMQSAYQIGVASTRANADAGEWDVWDTGVVEASQQSYVDYTGQDLTADTRYFWSVRFLDGSGTSSGWAAVQSWGTAPRGPWQGASPIWVQGVPAWGDYSLSAKVTITAGAAALKFRSDGSNGYMWQIRPDGLKPHKQTNGAYATLVSTNTGVIPYPSGVSVAVGTELTVRLELSGSRILTYIDDVLVSDLSDASFTTGGIGVRTGRTEAFSLDDVVLTTGSQTLFTDDFSGTNPFACGVIASSALTVGYNNDCVVVGGSWMLARASVVLPDKPIAWATLSATGSDYSASKQYVYKAAVNGDFVGLGPTASIAGESRFDSFDVTDRLTPGAENVISAIAYNSSTANRKFQAELLIAFDDGSTQRVATDSSWKVLDASRSIPSSGSIGSTYYAAPSEDIDLRAFPVGWQEPGFDDAGWEAPAIRAPFTNLVPTPTGKVDQQLHAPVSVVDKGNGDYFIDFGRSWIGGIDWRIAEGIAGQQIEVRFGEVTSAANTVKYQLDTGNVYRDKPVLRSGAQRIQTWGARVFRYVEIINSPEPVTAESLSALALVYPFDENASSLTTSNDNLQQVYQLSKDTIETTNLNFYTDSWTRERTNYEADAYLQLMSSLYLMDDLSLGRYSMEYFKSNRTWPTEWPIYVVLAVHDAWRQTGDVSQLAGYYDNLTSKLPESWFDPTTGMVRKTSGSDGCSSRTNCDIVDWPTSQRDGFVFRQYNTVINAISYRAYSDMAAIADALGRTDDANLYESRAEAIKTAVNDKLYDPDTGAYDDGADGTLTKTGHESIHASAFALAFGLVPEDRQATVADYVAGRGMACSVYCAAFVIKGLYAAGNGEAALQLLTATGTSSWMNMIELGAGATAEAWDPSQKPNLTYSHPWAASPAFNIPSGLFGIQPDTPGYTTFRVAPAPGDLQNGSMVVPTVKGSIGVAFSVNASGYDMAVSVPGNTTATAEVPTSLLDGTETTIWVDGLPRTHAVRGGAITVPGLTSGCHVLAASAETGLSPSGDLISVCESAVIDARTAPTAPGRPVVNSIDRDITISWARPADDGGSAITGYTVRLTEQASGSPIVLRVDAPATTATAEDVPAGTWAATVTAINGRGESPESLTSESVEITARVTPNTSPTPTPTVTTPAAHDGGDVSNAARGGPLAVTGSNALWWGLAAFLLLAVGLIFTRKVRRRP